MSWEKVISPHKFCCLLLNLSAASGNHCTIRWEHLIWMITYKSPRRPHLLVSDFDRLFDNNFCNLFYVYDTFLNNGFLYKALENDSSMAFNLIKT